MIDPREREGMAFFAHLWLVEYQGLCPVIDQATRFCNVCDQRATLGHIASPAHDRRVLDMLGIFVTYYTQPQIHAAMDRPSLPLGWLNAYGMLPFTARRLAWEARLHRRLTKGEWLQVTQEASAVEVPGRHGLQWTIRYLWRPLICPQQTGGSLARLCGSTSWRVAEMVGAPRHLTETQISALTAVCTAGTQWILVVDRCDGGTAIGMGRQDIELVENAARRVARSRAFRRRGARRAHAPLGTGN